MKTIIRMAMLGISLLIYASCMEDEIYSDSEVVEGKPALISLSLDESEPTEITTRTTGTGLDDNVKYVHILIFEANGGNLLKTKMYVPNYTGSAIRLSTTSGSSIIYVVANLSSAYAVSGLGASYFDDVTSLSGFKSKMAKTDLIGGFNESLLVMGGKSDVMNIAPGLNNPTSISLNRLSSKILVNVVKAMPATDRLDLLSWEVLNVPAYSYVDNGISDAVAQRPEAPADSNYFKSPVQKFAIITLPNNKQASQGIFYVFENRKGKVSSVTSQKKRASLAPNRATSILIKGRYADPSGVKDITYLVHLGKDSLTDYNVERNYKYTYTLTVKSANEYSTHVEVSKQDSRVNVNPLFAFDINEPTLDAHYDWRPIRLRSSVGFARIEVVDALTELPTSDSGKQWLKLSSSATWPTDAEIALTPSVTPSLSQTVSLTPGGVMLYAYADEMFDGTQPIQSSRKLKLKVTYTPSLNSDSLNNPNNSYVFVKEITQKPMLLFGNMGLHLPNKLGVYSATESIFGMEVQEEAIMKLGFSGLSATGLTDMLPWGFYGIQKQPLSAIIVPEFYRRNGMLNTIDLVWKSPSTIYDQSSSDFGSKPIGGAFDPIYNTYAARYCFEKNRDVNRDGRISGDEIKWYLPARAELVLAWIGKRALTVSGADLPSRSYWSSTENGMLNALNLNFSDGGTGGVFAKNDKLEYIRCVREIVNLSPSDPKSPYVILNTRQITGLPAGVSSGHPAHVKGKPFPIHGAEGNLNTVAPRFEIAQYDSNINGDKVLIPGTVQMEWYKACGWVLLPNETVNGTIASPATGCNAYWEGTPDNTSTGVGMWRMPTQRELMSIWLVQQDLKNGFTKLAADDYWSSPNYYSEAWYTNFNDGFTGATNRKSGDPLFKLNVRCVRDVTN